jgi:multiple sugar transport system substrate-binding protein
VKETAVNRSIRKAAVAAAASLALVLAGCSSGDDGESADGKTVLTITLWNYASTPEFKALIEGFQAAHPDIQVKPVDILADDYPKKITTMLAGGDSTDVITMKNVIDYARYGSRGQLVPLTDEAAKLDKTKYLGLDAFDLGGQTYALPYRSDFWILYYNKKLLKSAGVDLAHLTWQQYAQLAKASTAGTGTEQVHGTYQHTWRSVVQAIAAAQTGGDQLSGDYNFMANQYNLALDLEKAGATLPWATAKTQKVTYNGIFSTGKAAMVPMGTWYMALLLQAKPDVEWSIAPLPQVAASGPVTTFGSPTAFAVNKKAKHADAAKQFVTWASGPQGATILAKIGVAPAFRDQSILDTYFAVSGMPTDETAKKAFQPDKVVLEMPVNEKSSDVDLILNEEHELIMTGDKTVDAGLAEMGKRVRSEVP